MQDDEDYLRGYCYDCHEEKLAKERWPEDMQNKEEQEKWINSQFGTVMSEDARAYIQAEIKQLLEKVRDLQGRIDRDTTLRGLREAARTTLDKIFNKEEEDKDE